MALVAKKIEPSDNHEGREVVGEINKTYTSEIVIALCGPIGSPLHKVGESISNKLVGKFDYEKCETIRLSNFIQQHSLNVNIPINGASESKRISSLIQAGDALRKKYTPNVLAQLAVYQIRMEREKNKNDHGDEGYKPRRVCHIIDSIKNQEELDFLRLIYGDMLFVIGVFSPLPLREKNLATRGMSTSEIYSLIDRDSGAELDEGQTVRKTFPNSDIFLRIDKNTDTHLEKRVERFLNLILGVGVITPTRSETAMYAAAMASANSACLSRQVGACITDINGHILSVGWNDVPKHGGGLYTNLHNDDMGNTESDYRCWNLGGKCFNDEEKDILSDEIVAALEGLIQPDKISEAKKIIRKTDRLKNLIEFSRAIHAEMHAIINSGLTSGNKMVKGKLYATTYPCHSCARHIIAAGIEEVYFIEPYRKSLALKLHSDAITEVEKDTTKVRLLAYDGVAPSRYLSLFRVPPGSRKKDGKMVKVSPHTVKPRSIKSMAALAALEGIVTTSQDLKHLLRLEE